MQMLALISELSQTHGASYNHMTFLTVLRADRNICQKASENVQDENSYQEGPKKNNQKDSGGKTQRKTAGASVKCNSV